MFNFFLIGLLALIPNHFVVKSPTGEIIDYVSDKFGADAPKVLDMISCESKFDPSRIGDGGTSFGLFQIHLPSNPSVTKECALDAVCATEKALDIWRLNPRLWTCYRRFNSPLQPIWPKDAVD